MPADTINKVCASSIRAVEIADLMIRAGEHDVVVTGGMESMSNAPYLLPKARFGYRLGHGEVLDHMVFDGLTSTFDGCHMVEQASRVARELGISREEQDAWADRSHAACSGGPGRGPVRRRDRPGRRRRRATRASAATRRSRSSPSLKPVFDPEGTTTAGNAPGVNDGASCVVVCSEEYARVARPRAARDDRRARLRRGRLRLPRAHAGEGGRAALETAGQTIGDVARVEINEAFASVARTRRGMLGVDEEIVNVNGGAVALGHPIGASGGRIVGTLVHELRRSGGGLGLAAICSGGGQGDALLIEV